MPTKLSRFCEGIMEAAWNVAVILIPVFFNVYSSRIFEPDKIAILRSLALLILGAWIIKLVEEGYPRLSGQAPREPWYRVFLRTPLLPQTLLLALVYLISTIFSVTPRASIWGSYQRLQGFYTMLSYLVIFLSLVATLRRRDQIERLVTTIIISSLPVVLYGFLQRYKLDPIAWGGDTSIRIAANLGNSIFVAAYLIMVWPLTVGRAIDAFRAIWNRNAGLFVHIVRATLYLTLALLQPIAMYFSFSRGPLLGFGASLVFLLMLMMMLMVTNRRKRLILVTAIIVLGLSSAFGLLVLNMDNGPLQSLRQSPLLGRFGLLLNPESNSALVRKYIWEGAADLVAPHDPISFPDGSTDAFNILRPLIGYGPESMYVAFNPFYVPDLGRVEKRNASPDRSHNETWDSLVITGAVGFLVYSLVFISIFYYGLKWLGLVQSRVQKLMFWGSILGGGIVGTGLLISWGGVEWFGLGLPFGIAVGLVFVFMPLVAFTQYHLPDTPGKLARALLLVVLLSAILAHYLEINFGIAIAVTRTYFWIYAALLYLTGVVLPKIGVFQDSRDSELQMEGGQPVLDARLIASASSTKSSRRRRSEKNLLRAAGNAIFPWRRETLLGGLLLAILLSTLGYNYISNPNRQTSAWGILVDALTVLPNQDNARSYGIIGIVLLTLLIGVLFFVSENVRIQTARIWLKETGLMLGISLVGGLSYWVWQASTLAALARVAPQNTDELIAQVNRISGLLTNFYVWILLFIIGLAYIISRGFSIKHVSGKLGWGAAAVSIFIVTFLVVRTNLRIIHADITFKMAEPFATGNSWGLASLLYQRAIELAPDEDHYYLFLGRSYLEQAKTLQNDTDKSRLAQIAEADLKTAQKINPLNTDHTANLARLFTWWAGQATTATERLERGIRANDYYARALLLSPNHSTLWGEWAVLLMDVLNQPEVALEKLERALQLDEAYNFTQGLMGDYYLFAASRAQNKADKDAAFQKAIDYFGRAVTFSVGRDRPGKYQYLLSKGNAYVQWGSVQTPPDAALLMNGIQLYLEAIQTQPGSSEIWRVHEQIARLYYQLTDQGNALTYATLALQQAPEDYKARITELIAQIQQLSQD